MKVHMATISHPNGINMYVGGSKEELLAKLAGYVNEQPETAWPTGARPKGELTNDDLVFAYFNGNEREFLDEDNCEITPPAPIPHFAVDWTEQPGAPS